MVLGKFILISIITALAFLSGCGRSHAECPKWLCWEQSVTNVPTTVTQHKSNHPRKVRARQHTEHKASAWSQEKALPATDYIPLLPRAIGAYAYGNGQSVTMGIRY